jgi:hypothetical protein
MSLKHRWVDNIKMDLNEIQCEGMEWINLALGKSCKQMAGRPNVTVKLSALLFHIHELTDSDFSLMVLFT